MKVYDLKCEYLKNPLGIISQHPRLSWKLKSDIKGDFQKGYQIIVSRSLSNIKNNIGDLWDSGRIISDQSVQVEYNGKKLKSTQTCYWKVRVWDSSKKESDFSNTAVWEMGLLKENEWAPAKWISSFPDKKTDSIDNYTAPYLRNSFSITNDIESARAYICGVGYYELYLNGAKIGNQVLDPGFTRYDRRVLYNIYDIKDDLMQGKNAVGIILGNGFYNSFITDAWDFDKAPWRNTVRALCKIVIKYKNGDKLIFGTDNKCKTNKSPIIFNCLRSGETYDARKEITDWVRDGFNDKKWQNVKLVPAPKGKLYPQLSQPIRVTNTLAVKKLIKTQKNIWLADLGQNIAGWSRINVSGPAGEKVIIKYGETLNKDGSFSQEKIKMFIDSDIPFQTDTYILKGKGIEEWEPRFIYHGFQYMEITCSSPDIKLKKVEGRVVNTDMENIGAFKCSNTLFNKIQNNTLWSYIGNFHSIPTDCPQREKNGWMADAHLASEAGLINFDATPAYIKWMNDISDEMKADGSLPGIVPTSGWGYNWGNGPCWDSAYPLICWYLYLYRGDKRILEDHYKKIKTYIDYLDSKKDEDYCIRFGLGDWVPPYGCESDFTLPLTLSSTGYFYTDTIILIKAAELLGVKEDVKKYTKLAENIYNGINKRFLNTEYITVANGTMSSQATALYQNLIPEKYKKQAVVQMINDIKRQKYHLNCGIHTTKFLLHALSDNDEHETAYAIADQRTYPSWGYWIKQGATTLWESWQGNASRNHIMFGDISNWFYKNVAGIAYDEKQPGFKNIIIAPKISDKLSWAKAKHVSMYGEITVDWKVNNKNLSITINIPVNSTATVTLPAKNSDQVSNDGKKISTISTIKKIKNVKDGIRFELGSGKYVFHCPVMK